MPAWFWYLVVFAYGAIVGSFLNVVIYRLPLGLPISKPPSHCPRCNHYLGFFDNIPLLSFLFLGARCRYCRAPISWRYFTIELLTACLWVALLNRVAPVEEIAQWVNFVLQALFASVLIALVFIDLDHFFVPDEMNWLGVVLGATRDLVCLLIAWRMGGESWQAARQQFTTGGWIPQFIPGALVYGGLLFLVSLVGFAYYAREENESLGSVLRRFFTLSDNMGDETGNAPEPETGTVALPPKDAPIDEEEEGDPVRLRFSPAFLTFVSALLLIPTMGAWAIFAFAVPLVGFLLLSRHKDETAGQAVTRFFRADDTYGDGSEMMPVGTTDAVADGTTLETVGEEIGTPESLEAQTIAERQAQMAAEADQFARESESGRHGGMGLGDVKLALAIGAMLGPLMAPLSLFFATAVGAITGITLARIHNKSLRYGLPFVPFMAFGAIVVMLFGQAMLHWYLTQTGLLKPPPIAVP